MLNWENFEIQKLIEITAGCVAVFVFGWGKGQTEW